MNSTLPVTKFGFAAHRFAASTSVKRGNYKAARRHLREAARLDPTHAETRYLLGRAFEADPFGSDDLAVKHFRAAAKVDPGNATYRAAFGRAAVRAGRRVDGVKALVKAAALAPTDVAVLTVVVDGLLDAGKISAARRIVGRARFGNRLETFWNRVRFAEARAARPERVPNRILPFLRPVVAEGEIVRLDPPSRPRHHLGRSAAAKRFPRTF
jgi:predicted Zn-dependent protease